MTKEEKEAAQAAKKAEKAEKAAAKKAEKEAAQAAAGSSETEVIGDVEVGDPQLLRPVELPLVIKPADGGEWKNEAQAEYASILNAYAYKNPTKWAAKRAKLIANLNELGTNPGKLAVLKGVMDPVGAKVSYKDKRISN